MPPTDSNLVLPAGYALDRVLGQRGSVRGLRAKRGEVPVVLRLDETRDTQEGLAELAVLSAVDHPGVAALIDHGPLSGGGRYLARRWVQGEDLLTWAKG